MDFHSKALIFGFPQRSCKNRLQLPGKTRAMKISQPVDTCGHVHFVEDYHTGFIDLLYTPSFFKSSKSYGLNPSGWDARRTSKWKWCHVIYIYISDLKYDVIWQLIWHMLWSEIWFDMIWCGSMTGWCVHCHSMSTSMVCLNVPVPFRSFSFGWICMRVWVSGPRSIDMVIDQP